MEYVYVAMVSGYEEIKLLGVYTDLEKALEVAESFLEGDNFAYSESYTNAYAIQVKVNDKIVNYFVRDKNDGKILSFKV